MPSNEIVIAQTKNWINKVVTGSNFCPFAAREMKRDTVHYDVIRTGIKSKKQLLHKAFLQLDEDRSIETTLLIFPVSYRKFDAYLELLHTSERQLENSVHAGVYQLASFHPHYLFEGTTDADPANYTNRSLYPMLHILREESVTIAVDNHPDTNSIPKKNMAYAREKGLAHMQVLRQACFGSE